MNASREMTPEEIATQIVSRKRPRKWLANDLAAIIERAEKRGARSEGPGLDALSQTVYRLNTFARHRPWCREFRGPGDCTCGLYALLDSILCICGHKVNVHTTRDAADVVGWPCSECQSARCPRFALAAQENPAPARSAPSLDEGLLARAMHAVTILEPGLLSDVDMLNDPFEGDPLPAAKAVAREYRRLAQEGRDTAMNTRDRVIREITVAPGWNKEDATALVDQLLAEATPSLDEGLREALRAVLSDFDRDPGDLYMDEAVRIFRAALAQEGETP